jgi:hypothetical protein
MSSAARSWFVLYTKTSTVEWETENGIYFESSVSGLEVGTEMIGKIVVRHYSTIEAVYLHGIYC